jgi:hypothetical protein
MGARDLSTASEKQVDDEEQLMKSPSSDFTMINSITKLGGYTFRAHSYTYLVSPVLSMCSIRQQRSTNDEPSVSLIQVGFQLLHRFRV